MKNDKLGFSLPLAMGLIIVISLLAYTILEYIIPFSKSVKGVENSSKAYYQANTSIEQGLYHFFKRTNIMEEASDILDLTKKIDYSYSTTSSGKTLPPNGGWNRISQGSPIQLQIGNGNITGDLKIEFELPLTGTLSGSIVYPYLDIINWQLSGENNTLNATGSLINASQIDGSEIDLKSLQGVDLNGNETNNERFDNFYNNNCNDSGSGCILKLSVINKLELDSNNIGVPYLKWILKITGIKNIPLRYSEINASGKSYGFKKSLNIKIPQKTTNQALDFTVFQ